MCDSFGVCQSVHAQNQSYWQVCDVHFNTDKFLGMRLNIKTTQRFLADIESSNSPAPPSIQCPHIRISIVYSASAPNFISRAHVLIWMCAHFDTNGLLITLCRYQHSTNKIDNFIRQTKTKR